MDDKKTVTPLERAIELAVEKHKGQRDKACRPYILHLLRVMMRMRTDEERIVAVLHDIIEDAGVSERALLEAGFSREIVDAVVALTRRREPEPGESYADFIERAARNPLARRVKLADLEDNMDVTRLDQVTEKDRERLDRYIRSRKRILEVLASDGD